MQVCLNFYKTKKKTLPPGKGRSVHENKEEDQRNKQSLLFKAVRTGGGIVALHKRPSRLLDNKQTWLFKADLFGLHKKAVGSCAAIISAQHISGFFSEQTRIIQKALFKNLSLIRSEKKDKSKNKTSLLITGLSL